MPWQKESFEIRINSTEYAWLDGALVKKETLECLRKIQQTQIRANVEDAVAPSISIFGDCDFGAIIESPLEFENFIKNCRNRIPELTKKQRTSIEKTLARLEARAKCHDPDVNPEITTGIMSTVVRKFQIFAEK